MFGKISDILLNAKNLRVRPLTPDRFKQLKESIQHWFYFRASPKRSFLWNSKIKVSHNKFKYYLPKRSLKIFFKFFLTFSFAPKRLKFYYINRPCEPNVKWNYQENSNFFQFFITKLYFFLLNLNSLWKMWPLRYILLMQLKN